MSSNAPKNTSSSNGITPGDFRFYSVFHSLIVSMRANSINLAYLIPPLGGFQRASPLVDSNHVTVSDAENHSARFKTAADLEVPDFF